MENRGLRSEMQVYDDWCHLSYEEIKEIICKPLGSILWAYNNAIKKLRKKMEVA